MKYAETFEVSFGETNINGWVEFLEKEVAQEHAEAYVELANAYRNGLGGLETNAVKVVELLTYATKELESARARFELGECYMTGYGVEESDPEAALNLHFTAARQGHPPAEAKQGQILVLSGFAAKDDERMQDGIDMLRDAIDKGNLEAMMFMASRHELGDIPLIKKDIKLALMLYSALAKSGDSVAQKKVETLQQKTNK